MSYDIDVLSQAFTIDPSLDPEEVDWLEAVMGGEGPPPDLNGAPVEPCPWTVSDEGAGLERWDGSDGMVEWLEFLSQLLAGRPGPDGMPHQPHRLEGLIELIGEDLDHWAYSLRDGVVTEHDVELRYHPPLPGRDGTASADAPIHGSPLERGVSNYLLEAFQHQRDESGLDVSDQRLQQHVAAEAGKLNALVREVTLTYWAVHAAGLEADPGER
jgi:hypothetical protein